MSSLERNSIASPVESLLIYNTDTHCFEAYYNGGWVSFSCLSGCQVSEQPSAIIGTSHVCQGQIGVSYSVTNVSGVSYTWTYSGTGIIIGSGIGANSITANFSSTATSGILSVTGNNSCGSGTPQTFSIAVLGITAEPSNATICLGGNTSFSVTATGATSYQWQLSTNGGSTWNNQDNGGEYSNMTTTAMKITGALARMNNYTYRCVVSNANCTSYSNGAVLTFNIPYVCGTDGTFVDARDGQTYGYMVIGTQTWMCQNLAYLPSVVDGAVDMGLYSTSIPYQYVYGYSGNDVTAAKATANFATYGVLYNWTAAMNGNVSSSSNPSGVTGICPGGWHLPSDAEWCQMENTVEPGTDLSCSISGWRGTNTGNKLKATCEWGINDGATNTSHFTGLPGGIAWGAFSNIGITGEWYSATEVDVANSWRRELFAPGIQRFSNPKEWGLSVRCVKD